MPYEGSVFFNAIDILVGVRMVAQLLRCRKNSGKSTRLKSKNKLCVVVSLVWSRKTHKFNIRLRLIKSIEYQGKKQIDNNTI